MTYNQKSIFEIKAAFVYINLYYNNPTTHLETIRLSKINEIISPPPLHSENLEKKKLFLTAQRYIKIKLIPMLSYRKKNYAIRFPGSRLNFSHTQRYAGDSERIHIVGNTNKNQIERVTCEDEDETHDLYSLGLATCMHYSHIKNRDV